MTIESKNKYIYINNGNLKVVLSCLGAAIVEIKYDNDVMTLTPKDFEVLKRKDIYYGKTIGPVVNRIKDGLLIVDNVPYRFPLNEKDVCNHSGDLGLSNKIFDTSIDDNKVIFIYKDNMFDSNISYKVIYSFVKPNQIRIDYEVTTSNKAVVALTNHSFFNLGESNISNLSLKICSDKYIETDKDNLLPIREKALDTCIDFNQEKPIIKDIEDTSLINHKAKGYDHCLLLKDKNIVLKSPKYRLDIESNYACVQIYSDNYEDGVLTKNSNQAIRRAVAIEPEDNLLEKEVIHKGEIYHRYIVYSFKKI